MDKQRFTSSKAKAIYPGTFDPFTFGHLDILKRALKVFGNVVIAIAKREEKHVMFSQKERFELVLRSIKEENLTNVEVVMFEGLLIKFMEKLGIRVIVRGLRAISDFDYEFQMALTNRRLDRRVESIFFLPAEKHTFVSSSLVKEIAKNHGDVTDFVPSPVKKALIDRINALHR